MIKKYVFKPGINREGTSYSAEGGWYDGNKVRFRKGRPERIGGWKNLSTSGGSAVTYLGVCRNMLNWSSFNIDDYMGMGTSLKMYVELGGTYYDITPQRYSAEVRIQSDINTGSSTAVNVPTGTITNGSYLKLINEYVKVTGIVSGTPDDTLTISRDVIGAGVSPNVYDKYIPAFEIDKAIDDPIGVLNGSSCVVIRQTDHGATVGDYMTFLTIQEDSAGAGITRTTLLSGYDTDVSTQGFEVERVLNKDTFEITVTGSVGISTATTLSSEIDSEAVSITLASVTGISNGNYIKIDNEYIKVDGLSGSTFATCSRGQLGSDHSNHSAGVLTRKLLLYGGDVYIQYDVTSEIGSAASGSGFGSGTWNGRPVAAGWTPGNEFISSLLSADMTDSATIMELSSSDLFGSTGTAMVEGELMTYAANNTGTDKLSTIVRGVQSTNAVAHSEAATVYNINSLWTAWGEAAQTEDTMAIRIWSLDNFREDLVMAPRDGTPYFWDKTFRTSGSVPNSIGEGGNTVNSGAMNGQAVPLSSLGTPSDIGHGAVPTQVRQLMIYPYVETVVAFGCSELFERDSFDNPTDTIGGSFNPMLVRWSNKSRPGSWFPQLSNTAGGAILNTGSYIIGAARSKREVMVWTDEATYLMKWVATESSGFFTFTEIATGVSIVGPNAYGVIGDRIFWMGDRNFFVYDGSVKVLRSTVADFVYTNISFLQRQKVFCARNSEFSEVIWFYPSDSDTDNNRYVAYNYEDDNWSIGTLPRTAWSDSGIRQQPIASYIIPDTDGKVSKNYIQEFGSTGDGEAVNAYIETAMFDIDDGNNISYVSRIIPDVHWVTGGSTTSPMNISIFSQPYPQGAKEDPAQSVSVTGVDDYASVRVRGRQLTLRFETNTNDAFWRLGDVSMDIRPDGRR